MTTSKVVSRIVALLSLIVALPAVALAQRADDSARNRPGDYVINRPAGLYAKPGADSRILRELRPRTMVNVVEVLPQWYKVQSTKGAENGFVRRSYADPKGMRSGEVASSSGSGGGARRFRVGTFQLSDPAIVREQPSMSARRIATLREGAQVRIVDKDPSGLWYKIESEKGGKPPGWIPTQSAKRIPAN